MQPILLNLVVSGLTSLTVGQKPTSADLWYVISYAGQNVGYTETRFTGLQTLSRQQVVLRRLGKSVTVKTASSILENERGNVVSFHGELSSSNSTTTNDAQVAGSVVKLKISAAG